MGEVEVSGPRRLADFLRENSDRILAHWETQVRTVRAARHLERPLLIDHLPEFLEDLAAYVDGVRVGIDAGPPEEHPRIHALERLELGYDLSEVVFEYSILRSCITELAAETHTPALRSAELPRLHQAIDQAIATSVVRYTAARERTLRALDRISSAALVHHDVESLLPRTLDAFLETTASVDTVALALREDGTMSVRAAVGFPEPGPIGAHTRRDGFAARVEREGPVFVADASASADLARSPMCATGTHALYGVPLVMGKDFLGVAVMGSRSTREFSQEDQFLFRTMVNRLAALIAQARLDAEVARRAAELEAVIESIPEGVYVGDGSGFRHVNAAALQQVGAHSAADLSRITASGELQPRWVDGRPMPDEEQPYARALRGERSTAEIVYRHPWTGQDQVMRVSAAPVRLVGAVVGAVGVSTDITARIREEADLRAALDFRDRILGVLSHDLRTPLSVIFASAALIERESPLANGQRRNLERLKANAHRIERMIHDLLDYTRMRHGRRMPIAPREAALLPICQQVVDSVQQLHPDRQLQIEADGDTRALVDPDRAAQVVANLLTNAVRYGLPGTPVGLRLRTEPDAVLLSVHNDGAPIPAEMIPRLYQAFQRGVPSESGASAGLGLGLYIVQQIVEAHGGSIEVHSVAGDGTTFTVRWPR